MSLALSLIAWVRRLRTVGRRRKVPAGRPVYDRRRFRPQAEQLEEQLPPGSMMTGLGGFPPTEALGALTGSGEGGTGSSGTSIAVGAPGGESGPTGSAGDAQSGAEREGEDSLTASQGPSSPPANPGSGGDSPSPGASVAQPSPDIPPTAQPFVATDPGTPADLIYGQFGGLPSRPARKRAKRKPPRKKPARKRLNAQPPAPIAVAPVAIPTPAPAATPTPYLTLDNFDGATPGTGLTNDTTPTLSGTGTPGSTLRLSVDGHANAEGVVGSDGTWSLAVVGDLAEGEHTIKAEAIDSGRATGIETTPTTVVIDTTAPEVSLTAPAVSATGLPSFQASVTDPGERGVRSEVAIDVDRDGDGLFDGDDERGALAAQGGVGDFDFAASAELPEGLYSVRARVRDLAGNEAVSPTTQIQIDPNRGQIGSQPLLELAASWPAHGFGEQIPAETRDLLLEQFIKRDFSHLSFSADYRVGVNVRATHPSDLVTLSHELAALDMDVAMLVPEQSLVIGYLPPDRIMDLPTLQHFATVTPIYRPYTEVGSVTSQGDPVMLADSYRVVTGRDGTGVTVGVISDSANLVDSDGDGIAGILESQLTGDLPSRGVRILEEFNLPLFASDEGRAMLEIVHDVAPGATLAFATGGNGGPQGFARNVRRLRDEAAARVIVDDLTFLQSPYFNDGVLARAVKEVARDGVFYASSAGNNDSQGWQDSWRGTQGIVGGRSGLFHDLDPGPGVDLLQEIDVGDFNGFRLSFQWDSAFLEGGSPLPNYQVRNDLAVHILDQNGQRLQTIDSNNLFTDEALELGVFINLSFSTKFFLAFELRQGPAPNFIKWTARGLLSPDDGIRSAQGMLNTPTLWGHRAVRGVAAVGAAWALTSNTSETFSARGGDVAIWFDDLGRRLTRADIRRKPDFTAPDGANTSFFGSDAPEDADLFPNFFGTSAAAPHAAAGAALLIQLEPRLTPTGVIRNMQETARDINTPGWDIASGPGLIQMQGVVGTFAPSRPDVAETSERATDMGLLDRNVGTDLMRMAIATHSNGLPDYDWYRFKMEVGGTVNVTLSTEVGGDLEVWLYTVDGAGMLVQLNRDTTPGVLTRVATAKVRAGQTLLVEVKGRNSQLGRIDQGVYDLSLLMR